MKKIISLIICIILVFSSAAITFADEDGLYSWEERTVYRFTKEMETEWRFLPLPNYQSMQNPPSFEWPADLDADYYELIICSDRELQNVVYKADKISNNYYNFSYPFEKGKTYYWSVRFVRDTGISEWSEASRFLILPEAYDYVFPDIDEMIKKIKSVPHPRCAFTPDTIAEIRSYKDLYPRCKESYDKIYKNAENDVSSGIMDESKWSNANDSVYRPAFMYVLSGEKAFGDFAKKQLMEIASWDVEGATAYHMQDQHFRATMVHSAFAYDYVYDLLTPAERAEAAKMIAKRMVILEDPPNGLSDNIARLNTSPYLSHGWTALRYLIDTCIAMMGEIPEAEMFFRKWFPLFVNLIPHSYEDGDYFGGASYGNYSAATGTEYVLEKLTGFSLTNRPQYRNVWKRFAYQFTSKYIMEFGDEPNAGVAPNVNHSLSMISKGINPYIKWVYNHYEMPLPNSPITYLFIGELEKENEKAPISEPRSNLFKDTGTVAMFSDILNDADRICAYFRSSPFGSSVHSHADQNSFHIQAFGERLAIDSGYYDGYMSAFDAGYTRKTYAHNTITYDGGTGQPLSAAIAKGNIVNYLNHPDFDLTTGDATKAYNYYREDSSGRVFPDYRIDKAKRHFIYLRPDQFIVIDDLKAAKDNKVNFEWWLNAYSDISLYDERNGARITQGNAALDAKIQYPEVNGYYLDIFSGPDKIDVFPLIKANFATKQVNKRVWFETPKTNQTRIIATMDVRRTRDEARYVKSEQKDGYMYLSFEDGTKAYISTEGSSFDTGRYHTDADAVVIKEDSIMVVDGSYLIRDGEEILKADKKISMTLGKREIGLSSAKDFNARVKTGEITALKSQTGTEEAPGQMTRGFNWSCIDGYLNVEAYNGFYNYLINDKPLPGVPVDDYNLTYNIGDTVKNVTLKGYLDHDGKKVLSGNIENEAGFYLAEEINNVSLKGLVKGDIALLAVNEPIMSTGVNATLKIKPLSDTLYQGKTDPEHEAVKSELSSFAEAEDFGDYSGTISKYTSRKFLSGGAGASGFNILGDYAVWEFNVPENGKYDLVVKYVGWAGVNGTVKRIIDFNGNIGTIDFPETGSYGAQESEWVTYTANTSVELKKGKASVTVYPIFGSWNIDWFGLKKSE